MCQSTTSAKDLLNMSMCLTSIRDTSVAILIFSASSSIGDGRMDSAKVCFDGKQLDGCLCGNSLNPILSRTVYE